MNRPILLILSALVLTAVHSQGTPDMKYWTDAWLDSNSKDFKNLYAKDAIILPPNKYPVVGNQNILDFMKDGFGKVKVIFQPDKFVAEDTLAFEYGFFIDLDIESDEEIGKGRYSVTWILINDKWKILSHSWSIPQKKSK